MPNRCSIYQRYFNSVELYLPSFQFNLGFVTSNLIQYNIGNGERRIVKSQVYDNKLKSHIKDEGIWMREHLLRYWAILHCLQPATVEGGVGGLSDYNMVVWLNLRRPLNCLRFPYDFFTRPPEHLDPSSFYQLHRSTAHNEAVVLWTCVVRNRPALIFLDLIFFLKIEY